MCLSYCWVCFCWAMLLEQLYGSDSICMPAMFLFSKFSCLALLSPWTISQRFSIICSREVSLCLLLFLFLWLLFLDWSPLRRTLHPGYSAQVWVSPVIISQTFACSSFIFLRREGRGKSGWKKWKKQRNAEQGAENFLSLVDYVVNTIHAVSIPLP